jgi:hypothetical protein
MFRRCAIESDIVPLWRLCRAEGSKWQKRVFMAKDGFLLYYGTTANPNAAHFDTKPKVR